MYYKILTSLLAVITINNTFALSCSEAKTNMLEATREIRSNHHTHTSFNEVSQDEVVSLDMRIMKNMNYKNSKQFYLAHCTKE